MAGQFVERAMSFAAWMRARERLFGWGCAALATAILLLTHAGGAIDRWAFFASVQRLRALVPGAGEPHASLALIVADDATVKQLGRTLSLGEWKSIAALLLREGGYRAAVVAETPETVSGWARPADASPLPERRAMIGGVVAMPSLMSRATKPDSFDADLWRMATPAASHAGFRAAAVLAPPPALASGFTRFGHVNVGAPHAVPLRIDLGDGLAVHHVAYVVAREVATVEEAHEPPPAPADGLLYTDYLPMRRILSRGVSAKSFFRDATLVASLDDLPQEIRVRLAQRDVALLVPSGYTGTRYENSPLDGQVPTFAGLFSQVSAALGGRFLVKPLADWLVVLAVVLLGCLAASARSRRRSAFAVCGVIGLTAVAGCASYHYFGLLLPVVSAALPVLAFAAGRSACFGLNTMTAKAALAREQALGKEVQQLLFEASVAAACGPWSIRVGFQPYGALAGDWYRIYLHPDDREAVVAIGDVVGKGTSAALVTTAIAAAWEAHCAQWRHGVADLGALHGALDRTIETLFRAQQNTVLQLAKLESKRITLSCHGGPRWWLYAADGRIELIRTKPSNALGGSFHAEFSCIERAAEQGDIYVCFTDGLFEGGAGRTNFEAQLRALDRSKPMSARLEDVQQVLRAIKTWASIADDTTWAVIAFEQ